MPFRAAKECAFHHDAKLSGANPQMLAIGRTPMSHPAHVAFGLTVACPAPIARQICDTIRQSRGRMTVFHRRAEHEP
jgi:ABC-type branched-subunit amino acid transport system ATPase component